MTSITLNPSVSAAVLAGGSWAPSITQERSVKLQPDVKEGAHFTRWEQADRLWAITQERSVKLQPDVKEGAHFTRWEQADRLWAIVSPKVQRDAGCWKGWRRTKSRDSWNF
jgi:hypothetical protein